MCHGCVGSMVIVPSLGVMYRTITILLHIRIIIPITVHWFQATTNSLSTSRLRVIFAHAERRCAVISHL